jgi:hypothetical protein
MLTYGLLEYKFQTAAFEAIYKLINETLKTSSAYI